MKNLKTLKYCGLIAAFGTMVALFGACQSAVPIDNASYDTLVWSDEFNATGIDLAKWKYETANTGWSNSWNNELQDYVDNGTGGTNAFINLENDGSNALVLRATRKATSNAIHSFDSARLITQGKFEFTHGRVEARMKLPKGNGIWPAFWMLGTNGNWPANGEIDIMEMIGGNVGVSKGGGDNTLFSTLHWGTDPNHPSRQGKVNVQNAGEWHDYRLYWSSQYLVASMDGQEYFRMDISGGDKACFHKPFYLLLNLAVGGSWPGNPDDSTPFPADFKIDYIRVYQ